MLREVCECMSKRTDKNVNVYLEMQCKSLWIKASAKCINVKAMMCPRLKS